MQMQRFTVQPLIILSVILVGIAFWSLNRSPLRKLSNVHKGPSHPAYYEQLKLMKQNEAGEIPVGLRNNWYKHDKLFKQSENLLNIAEWGPTNVGGRTRALAIDLANSNRILAGAASGGMWLSEDRGKTWNLRDDHALSLVVTCVTQNPLKKNEFYYGTGESTGNSTGIAGNGVFKSDDNGLSFSQLPATNTSNFTSIWDIKHSLTDSNTLFVATNSAGLWKSIDAGKTFTRIYSTSSPVHEIEVFEDTTIMFTVQGSGIFQMQEKSTSPIKLGGGLPTSSLGRISLSYCQSYPDTMYAQFMGSGSTASKGIYRSNDRGLSWITLTNPPTSTISYSWAWYSFDIAVHPTNSDWLISVSVSAGFSKDGGITWSTLKGSHADYHTVRFFPGENNLLIGNDGGIYEYNTATAGSAFIDRKTGYKVTQFYSGAYFPTGQDIIGGTQDNGTKLSTAENINFLGILGGDGSYCAIDQKRGSTVYASSQNAVLRRSNVSNITSWTDIDNAFLESGEQVWFINPFEINPIDGDQVYFPTKQRLWRSADQGNNWSQLTNKLIGAIYSVAVTPQANPTVYIGGQSSLFYRINNAMTATPGSEYMMTTLVPTAAKGGFIGNIEINPLNEKTLYLAMSNLSTNPRLWKVWNADSDTPTWVNISSNLPSELPVNWIEVDAIDTNMMAAATDFGLYTSINGGASWEKEMSIPNVSIPMIRLRAKDRQLFIFTHGRGVWKSNMPRDAVGISKNPTSLFVSIYPNPTSDILKIKSTLAIKEVSLFTLAGSKVFGVKESSEIDIASLPSGAFIVTVELADGNRVTKKILKQ
jgi:photosystem II stability/assembly factor-like uncharacterized protein